MTYPHFCRPSHKTPHLVYRMFDAEGALIYIGMTRNLPVRLNFHLHAGNPSTCSAEIRARYASHTTEEHPDYHSAHDAEIAAIYAEMPELNRQHNHQAWRWDGKANKWLPREQVAA